MNSVQSGVTLSEVMVTIAVLGLIAFTISNANNILVKMNRTSINTQSMSYDSIAILTNISTNLKKCGDGLRGISDPSMGKTVIALPDDLLNNFMPEIIFLFRDEAPIGSLGLEDSWKRFSTGVQDGRDGLLIQTYQTDNWLDIKAGNVAPLNTQFLKTQDGIKIVQLAFTLYDSQDPPRIANQDPNTSSAVRVVLRLKKGDSIFENEKNVTLENLLYGPN